MPRKGQRPRTRHAGPCPECGRVLPLTGEFNTVAHKKTLLGTVMWCYGGYVSETRRVIRAVQP